MSDQLTRKIYFYQIDWIKTDRENPVTKDLTFLESILNLESNKLLDYTEDSDIFIKNFTEDTDSFIEKVIPKSDSDIGLWKLVKVRKTGFPQKINMTKLNEGEYDLDMEKYEGLCETSHFAIFDGKFLLSESNYYGARVNSNIRNIVNNFLKNKHNKLKNKKDIDINKFKNLKEIRIKPLLEEDVIKKIDDFKEIRGVSIKVATDYAERLAKTSHKHSMNALFSSAQLVDDMYLNLSFTLGNQKSKSPDPFGRIIPVIKEICGRNDFNAENFKKMDIMGRIKEGEPIIPLNLIDMIMKTERRVLKLDDKTRAVNPENMYKELLKVYETYEELLKKRYSP